MIAIIAAIAGNGVIGCEGKLPWQGHLPADMQRFRELTVGKVVIMGRKTWESLPNKFRPLPDRVNIVLSRDASYDAPGAIVTSSLARALEMSKGQAVFVIGGSSVYEEALPLADKLYITRVTGTFPGDVFFPDIDDYEWELTREDEYSQNEQNHFDYAFQVLERRR